jgi:sulfate adenylyltransferase
MTTDSNQSPLSGGRHEGVPPHGGSLVDLCVSGRMAEELLAEAAGLPKISMDTRAAADAELLATGAFSPLTGFVGKADYLAIVERMRLAPTRGEPPPVFPIPITLAVERSASKDLREGRKAALVTEAQGVVGVIAIEEIFELDRPREAQEVYRTQDRNHPGVAYLFARSDEVGVGGKITLAKRTIERKFPAHHRDPKEVRDLIKERQWRKTVAFQTRNPIHRAHEYLLRVALETVDGLVVHPLVGDTKGDDVPASVRMRCYEALLDNYFPKERVLLSVFPFAMRYAGPREAVLHAIVRQNYGFSHFIVGRDHAGVGNYYGTYDAQRIFETLAPTDLRISLLFFEHSFYCKRCEGVASLKTCPHDAASRLTLSGTRVRELLRSGQGLPPEYSRPEVARILTEAYKRVPEEGVEPPT